MADDSGEKNARADTSGGEPGELASTGRNRSFVLEPGYVLRFEGTEKGKKGALTITVLDETLEVDGVETREVRAGDARPGAPGARYYQEVAPGRAMDRSEIVGLAETLATTTGAFKDVLKTEGTTPLEPDNIESKCYAPGIGLIKDGPMTLVRSGFAGK